MDHKSDSQSSDEAGVPDASLTMSDVVGRLDRLWSSGRDHDPATNSPSRLIGNYEIQRLLGYGSFGLVYLAHDKDLRRPVALKIPRPEVLLDMERLSRFEGEAATAALLDHPAIVTVYSADLSGPTPYIASAYCTGPDLARWLESKTTPPAPRHVAQFVAELADAVEYAHQQGVLHRDLKPSNVMLEPLAGCCDELDQCQPRLTDFGLAKVSDSAKQDTKSSLLIGTPLYMAPEQLWDPDSRDSPLIDVYAMGAILFELLTLRPPFEGSSYTEVLDAIRHDDAPRLRSLAAKLPVELETICEKCLAKDPLDRYQSAREVNEELRRYLAGEPLKARPVAWRGRLLRWCRQENRIQLAVRVSLTLQLMLLLWTPAVMIASHFSSAASAEAMRRSLHDYTFTSLCIHGPIAIASWLPLRGYRWAFWLSMLGNLALSIIFTHAALSDAIAFDYNYPTRLSKLTVVVPLAMACWSIFMLHVMAMPAWFRQRKQLVDRKTEKPTT